MRSWFLLWCLIVAPLPALAEAGPVFSAEGPDLAGYGADEGYPVRRGGAAGALPPAFVGGSYSHYHTIPPHRVVARPAAASPLPRAPQELTLAWRYRGIDYTLDSYLERNPTTGLLIARGDTILYEHYRYGRTDRDRLLSQSMAKTVTSMLLGIAVAEGAIRSIDQSAADYVPELAGSAYGTTSIRDLLHMASGVAFTEIYDGADDNAKLSRLRSRPDGPGAARALIQFNTR